MTSTHSRAMTLEQFLALPEQQPALEFADGRVTQKVSPLGEHARLQSAFWGLLNNFSEPRRIAMAFTEIRTTFAGRSPVPDIGVYRWSRIPRTADGLIETYFRTPPDIAVEIFSPGQVLGDERNKCRWYVANGVPIALFVHHPSRTVTRFTPDGEQRLAGDDRIDLDAVLPGFTLTVAELFATLRVD
ncbi:MAG: Uma2 family endonuclease [Dehalococcoidia bacterium]